MQLHFYFPFKSLFIQTQQLSAALKLLSCQKRKPNPIVILSHCFRSPLIDFYKLIRYILKLLAHKRFLHYFSSPLLRDKLLPSADITFFPLLSDESSHRINLFSDYLKAFTRPMLHSSTASLSDFTQANWNQCAPLPWAVCYSFCPER